MIEILSKPVKFFGLLHLSAKEKSAINVNIKSFEEQIQIYIKNASLLSRSLKAVGIDFILLTNDVPALKLAAEKCLADLNIVGIPCSTPVPSGLPFYSAHFKLDAYRYIAAQEVWWAALCDLDMLCIQRRVPAALINCINCRIPLYYDISDQVIPAYGHEKILNDVKVITGDWSDGRWLGGEFVAGPPSFFLTLAKTIDTLLPNYFNAVWSLHHIGDEAYTTAAIQKIHRESFFLLDAGSIGIIGRYWSVPVRHPQRSLKYFENCFLLHLPADKRFLARYSENRDWNPEKFFVRYRLHARANFVKLLFGASVGSRARWVVGKLYRMVKARVIHA